MDKENQSLTILIEAAKLAQTRGAFDLKIASLVAEAVSLLEGKDIIIVERETKVPPVEVKKQK